jgi:hypothetical protein
MISWQRLIFMLCLTVVEATPAAMPLALLGLPGAWLLVALVVLAGALADWLVAIWLPVERQQPALIAVGLATGLWAAKIAADGGFGLVAGWGTLVSALFSTTGRGGMAYLTFLIGLYMFRRGTHMLEHDSISLRRLFARASVGLLLILSIGLLGATQPNDARVTLITVMLLTFFAFGLMAIALAAAAEEHDTQLSRLGWRGVLTLCAAIGLVLVLGLAFAALFGQDAARSVRAIIRMIVLLFALVMLPFLFLLSGVLERLARMIDLRGFLRLLQENQLGLARQQQQVVDMLSIFPPWAQVAMRVFFALLPILIIVALYVLFRRRARRTANRDEERESLWSWSGLAADLRDLLAGLRREQIEEGLRAALARLRDADPVSRIRRSYIRFLLAGEARERPRAAPQTPREYAPDASAALPDAAQPIAALTAAYERARYHPAAATSADADAAEQAWSAIEAADRKSKRV